MKLLVINRDRDVDRLRNVRGSFEANAGPGWEFTRFPASESHAFAHEGGPLSPSERACRASHVRALASVAGDSDDVAILEDDTRFSRAFFRSAPAMLAAAPTCDVLFMELMPTDFGLLAHLAKQWPSLVRDGNFLMHDLSRTGFIGASAYCVRGGAKAKVLAGLAEPDLRDTPFDIALRDLARTRRIEARVAFPFLTSPSLDADRSTIQPDAADLRQATLHAYRRLMFVERDLAASTAELSRLQGRHGDPAATLVGGVFAALISEVFPDAW